MKRIPLLLATLFFALPLIPCRAVTINVNASSLIESINSISENTDFVVSGELPNRMLSDVSKAIQNSNYKVGLDLSKTTGLKTIIYKTFYGCFRLKSIIMPDSVTEIEDASFRECYSLENVKLPNNLESIGKNAFRGCISLKSISIPRGVTLIPENAFAYCIELTSITMEDGLTFIHDDAFEDCINIKSVTIPKSVTYIENPFSGCDSLEEIVVEDGNSKYDSRNGCNGIIETSTNTLIAGCKNTVVPDSVTKINWQAFCGCAGLADVKIPGSVTEIDSAAFSSCKRLKSITIPKSVTSIKSCFSGCDSLEQVVVEEGNYVYDSRNNCNGIIETSTNTLIAGCKNTVIPDGVTKIGNSAFRACTGLTDITIPDSVTEINYLAFAYCGDLKSISIPDSVMEIRNSAFCGCPSLKTINASERVIKMVERAMEEPAP